MRQNYYRVLGVDRRATLGEIHRAWREIARSRHPDRRRPDASDSAVMALANEAWSVLGDSRSRRAYDQSLRVPEPVEVQDAILGAAWTVVCGPKRPDGPYEGRDFTVTRESARVAVRTCRTLDAEAVRFWLRAVAALRGDRCSPECAVVLACRIIDPTAAVLGLGKATVPAVAIDLIESRAYGEFPSVTTEAFFRVFLGS